MKTNACIKIALAGLVLMSAVSACAAQSLPIVAVREASTVSTDFITLGDIADITPSPQSSKASARLAATVVGRSPLPGDSRPLTRGDIMLKLRQAGIDPTTVEFEGASDLTIAHDAGPSIEPVASAPAVTEPVVTPAYAPQAASKPPVVQAEILQPAVQPSATPAAPVQPDVRCGDEVQLVLIDGCVTLQATGFALGSGSVGDHINIRRDGAINTLSGVIIAQDEVQLEE